MPYPQQIRFVGPNPSEGKVEVNFDGRGYGTICSNGWDNKVCWHNYVLFSLKAQMLHIINISPLCFTISIKILLSKNSNIRKHII